MSADPIAVLVEHGDEHGCVHLTELYELVQRLELEEHEIEALLERLEAHGIDITDNCSRAIEEANPGVRVAKRSGSTTHRRVAPTIRPTGRPDRHPARRTTSSAGMSRSRSATTTSERAASVASWAARAPRRARARARLM